MERNEYLLRLRKGYLESYDELSLPPSDLPLVCLFAMHARQSQYVVSKKVETFSVNSHVYTYVFSVPSLTKETVSACLDYAYQDGLSRVDLKSDKNHMSTKASVLFIADEISMDAIGPIRSCSLHKNFLFSLRGWLEVSAAGISLKRGEVCNNRAGKEEADYLRAVYAPDQMKKKSNVKNILKEIF